MPLATSIVFQVAGAVVLLATAAILFGAFRDRGRRRARSTPLGRAESTAFVVGAIALGLTGLTDSEAAVVVWILAVFAVIVIAAVRHRRGEPRHPPVVVDGALRADIVGHLGHGRTIEAIKLTRIRTDCGLVVAKQAVDRVAETEGLTARL